MSKRTFTSFYLGDQLFGIDILGVREINRQLDISYVPHGPQYIKGLVNLRGQIVTIMDLNDRLGLGKTHLNETTHNVILKTDLELASIRDREDRHDLQTVVDKVGLMVDNIADVVTIDEEEIEDSPANIKGIDSRFLSGIVKLDDALMGVLNLQQILSLN